MSARRSVDAPTTPAADGAKWPLKGGTSHRIPTTLAAIFDDSRSRVDARLSLDSLADSALALVDRNDARAREPANRILRLVNECREAIEAGAAATAVFAALEAAGIWWRAAYAVHWLDDANIGERVKRGGPSGTKGGTSKGHAYADANAALARAARVLIRDGFSRDEVLVALVQRDLKRRSRANVERALRKSLGAAWTNTPRIRKSTSPNRR